MANKQNADASESFRQLMAAYSKAFSSTPDSVKEEENADDTATTTENGTTPSPRTASILDADDETTETALEFNLERAKLLNRQKEQKNPRSSSSPGWQQASEKSSASYGSSHATSSPSTTNTVTVKPKNKTQNKPNWKKTP